uniref:Uncharacterized protein n=1 Tax=Rhizophora mucronata TaxID=61149 RepID=A0A2P2Q6J3_RHIMU
MLIGSLALFLN